MKNEKNQQKQLQKKIGEFAENFCCQRLNICLLKKNKNKTTKNKKRNFPSASEFIQAEFKIEDHANTSGN